MDEQGWLERAMRARRVVLSALRSGSGDFDVLTAWVTELESVIRGGARS